MKGGLMLISIFKNSVVKIALWAFPIIILGCQSNKTDKAHQVNGANSVAKDTMTYEMRTIKEISPYIAEHDDVLDTSYAEVTYPVFQDSNLNNLVQSTILIDGEPNIQTYANNFIEGYGNFIEENDLNYPIAWTKSTNVNISLYSPELICIKNSTYEFSGGAHGSSFENISVFELENFRKLALNSFISDNKMKEFTKIAENIFRKAENLSDTSSLERDYFFEEGKFALSANYGITKNGIMFHYNPYEIKPYAAGTTTIVVPFSEIKEFMTETGKLYVRNLQEYFQSI